MMSQIICDINSDLFVSPVTAAIYLNDQLYFDAEINRWSNCPIVKRTVILPYCKSIIPSFLESIGITSPLIDVEARITENKSLHVSSFQVANRLKRALLSSVEDRGDVLIMTKTGVLQTTQPQAIVYICNESIKKLKDDHFSSPFRYISTEEQIDFMKKFDKPNQALYDSCIAFNRHCPPIYSDIYCFSGLTEIGKSTLLAMMDSLCLELGVVQEKGLRSIIESVD
jgi:hypothetical protein